MGNPVVHFEISTSDPETLGKFYQQLFGWNVVSIPEPAYTLIDTAAGKGINGGIGGEDENGQRIKAYIEVADLQKTLDKIGKLGGKTVMEPRSAHGFARTILRPGWQRDRPYQSRRRRTGSIRGEQSWHHLVRDPWERAAKLQRFYADAFDWKFEQGEADDVNYGRVVAEGRGIPGGISGPHQGQEASPEVNIYAEVDDLQKCLDKAADLGAKTLLEPMVIDKSTSIAMFADPQGNTFGLWSRTNR